MKSIALGFAALLLGNAFSREGGFYCGSPMEMCIRSRAGSPFAGSCGLRRSCFGLRSSSLAVVTEQEPQAHNLTQQPGIKPGP